MKMRLTHPFLMTFCNLIHYNRDTQTEWQVRQGKILKRQFIETICHSSHKLLQFLMNQSRHICCRIVFLLGYDFFVQKKLLINIQHYHQWKRAMKIFFVVILILLPSMCSCIDLKKTRNYFIIVYVMKKMSLLLLAATACSEQRKI